MTGFDSVYSSIWLQRVFKSGRDLIGIRRVLLLFVLFERSKTFLLSRLKTIEM